MNCVRLPMGFQGVILQVAVEPHADVKVCLAGIYTKLVEPLTIG
jgi:hypothetical protein